MRAWERTASPSSVTWVERKLRVQVLELGERREAGVGDGSAVLEVEGLEVGEGGEVGKCLIVNTPYVS